MKQHLRAELSLTPEQVAKVSPIIDNAAQQLQEVRRGTLKRVREIMAEAHRKIALNLTDEQRQKMEQMKERHHRWRHRHGRHEFPPESPAATP
jgi:Spy/CpxP family protein refolding chaperone